MYTEGFKSRYTSILCITLITVYLLLHPSVFDCGKRWVLLIRFKAKTLLILRHVITHMVFLICSFLQLHYQKIIPFTYKVNLDNTSEFKCSLAPHTKKHTLLVLQTPVYELCLEFQTFLIIIIMQNASTYWEQNSDFLNILSEVVWYVQLPLSFKRLNSRRLRLLVLRLPSCGKLLLLFR